MTPCQVWEQRFHELLDQRQDPALDARIQRHVDYCSACRENLETQLALTQQLDVSPVSISADFTDRVLQAAAEQPAVASATYSNAPYWRAVIAIAAAVLVFVGGWRWLADSPQKQPDNIATSDPEAPPKEDLAEVPTIPIPMELSPEKEDEPSPRSLIQPENLEDQPGNPFWELLAQNLPEPSPNSLESVQELAEPIRPIASSLTVAFTSLRDSLSVGKTPKTMMKT